jgi:hypothetical protein
MPLTKETEEGVRGRPPGESVSARANEQAKGQTTLDKTSLEDYSTSRVETEPQGAPGILEPGARGARRSLLPWSALHNDGGDGLGTVRTLARTRGAPERGRCN